MGLSFLAIITDWVLYPSAWAAGVQAYNNFLSIGLTINWLIIISYFLSLIAGITLLLGSHLRFRRIDPDLARKSRIVIWGTALGIAPLVLFSFLPFVFTGGTVLAPTYGFLFFLIIPLAYAYAIFQKKLIRVDFAINRAVVFFVLALAILGGGSLLFVIVVRYFNITEAIFPLLGGSFALLVAIPSTTLRQKIQVVVNQILYGDHYDYELVTSNLSGRLAQVVDRHHLAELLTSGLTKQMGIEQSVLYLADRDGLLLKGEGESSTIPIDDPLATALLAAGEPVYGEYLVDILSEKTAFLAWGKIFAPIIFDNHLQGILVLGLRARSSLYRKQDLEIITTVAHQTALATANVQLVEKLRGLTHWLVQVDEERRKQAARDLHDAVLQVLFFIKQRLLREPKQVELATHLDGAIEQLRRTIKAQRTSLLDQGLPLALHDLVTDMQKLAGKKPAIRWEGDIDISFRVADETATSVYRIAQESISNALKHARAETITVSLAQEHDVVRLSIEDDGIGMPETEENRQGTNYGLIGMRERAMMIGADLQILSTRGEGTKVSLKFKP